MLTHRKGKNSNLKRNKWNTCFQRMIQTLYATEVCSWRWDDQKKPTVLLGQLYCMKTSWALSSPPSVNSMMILLQFARGTFVFWKIHLKGRWTRRSKSFGLQWNSVSSVDLEINMCLHLTAGWKQNEIQTCSLWCLLPASVALHPWRSFCCAR